ncbi:hypothetical protein LENED_012904 [Lentinula edodes]|uniref:Uncharacterized protein n=1 Tax=Lentinula edodes TaxID=5353 RepID=A0A1Q3ETR2_LENED|nr:hypothetical protein LENED_012904 [Lentinula edodes]
MSTVPTKRTFSNASTESMKIKDGCSGAVQKKAKVAVSFGNGMENLVPLVREETKLRESVSSAINLDIGHLIAPKMAPQTRDREALDQMVEMHRNKIKPASNVGSLVIGAMHARLLVTASRKAAGGVFLEEEEVEVVLEVVEVAGAEGVAKVVLRQMRSNASPQQVLTQ